MKLIDSGAPAANNASTASDATACNLAPEVKYILGIDVGSSVIRCHVYDKAAVLKGFSSKQVEALHPQPGWVELDPESLWTQFIDVIKEAVQVAGLKMNQISALGLSTQRATFITWNKKTGKPFHNFISWQDVRAANLIKSWNRSFLMKAVHGISSLLHFFTRINKLLLARSFSFTTQHVSLRLVWILQHLSEVQCMLQIIQMPVPLRFLILLSHIFGSVDAEIFGVPIAIAALAADQQAAMFGQCCFDTGDIKVTMGTGTFWDINTGNNIHVSKKGLYPLVGWKIGNEITFLAEGNASDTGNAIKWIQSLELFDNVEETSQMAHSLVNSGGVCFVPSFSGLQIPVNDPYACTSFMGITPTTTKKHLVRAVLESIAFRNKQLYDIITTEVDVPSMSIRADGGVTKNSFVMQMTSDLINESINKPDSTDMSCLGAAFLAGLAIGYWTDKEHLKTLRQTDIVFKPQREPKEYEPAMSNWIKAVRRSLSWYSQTSQ
ncbi:putative glycerol kinase 5 isoform X2 [Ahaetulla prasina]|uniref:putative glycerol kinase 5 isoform X2 n=1 Tax=Ahaetulla prasina TaxID=499056 RepID=UPI002648DE4C|nr:putative glycerol kinase 5 isoform X2 [Ahaetulla prasina]